MSAPHFVVHDNSDSVGVVVVETVEPQTEMTGWNMETDETIHITALDAIPIGHKVALSDLSAGDTAMSASTNRDGRFAENTGAVCTSLT